MNNFFFIFTLLFEFKYTKLQEVFLLRNVVLIFELYMLSESWQITGTHTSLSEIYETNNLIKMKDKYWGRYLQISIWWSVRDNINRGRKSLRLYNILRFNRQQSTLDQKPIMWWNLFSSVLFWGYWPKALEGSKVINKGSFISLSYLSWHFFQTDSDQMIDQRYNKDRRMA